MRSISLSDQMTVVALIDELRYQRKLVQEHLDLPRRRAEIAERIRAYYLSQDLPVDDDLIEQGVHQFFARRLILETPPTHLVSSWLIRTLVSRQALAGRVRRMLPRFGILLLLGVVLGVGVLLQKQWASGGDDLKILEVKLAAHGLSGSLRDQNTALEKLRTLFAKVQRENVQQPDETATRLLQRAEQKLPARGLQTDISSNTPVTRDNVLALDSQINDLDRQRLQLNRDTYAAEQDIQRASGILGTRRKVQELLKDPKRAAAIAQSSNLDERLAEIDQALKNMDDNQGTAYAAYSELSRDLFGDTSLLDLQTSRFQGLRARIERKEFPAELRESLQSRLQEIEADLKKGNSNAAETKITQTRQKLRAAGYWSLY
ncbi:hypothetical protein K5E40_30315 [Pseudomonas baetica]|uniref:DUF6384 family protein n=1 Tax=Pseudomonas baetica TaxID=674054 RepID=UPI001C8BD15E|nr:DUF6384 family protein [Pseudomonas baetica]MBX9409940.1 hypothetical protein [Pseudomonas baetica]